MTAVVVVRMGVGTAAGSEGVVGNVAYRPSDAAPRDHEPSKV